MYAKHVSIEMKRWRNGERKHNYIQLEKLNNLMENQSAFIEQIILYFFKLSVASLNWFNYLTDNSR